MFSCIYFGSCFRETIALVSCTGRALWFYAVRGLESMKISFRELIRKSVYLIDFCV